MSVYFKYNDEVYFFGATETISSPRRATLSKARMLDQKQASDNYTREYDTVTITGVITDVFLSSNTDNKSTTDWLRGIDRIIDNQSPVTLSYQAGIEPTLGWFITSIDPVQNTQYGVWNNGSDGNGVKQAFQISITFERPRLARGAFLRLEPVEVFRDALADTEKKNSSTSKPAEKETPQTLEEKRKEIKERIVSIESELDVLADDSRSITGS